MWIQDAVGKNFLAVNDAFVSLLGYSRTELLSFNIRDIELNEYSVEKSSKTNISFKTKNGEILKFELSVFDLTYLSRNAQMFTVINQTKETVPTIENNLLFVQEYDSALKAFFNSSGSILVLFNKNLEITAFNPKAQIYAKSLFKTEFVIGKNVVEILPAQFQETFKKLALQALDGNETNNREVKIPNTDLWWSLKYFPLYTSTGKIFGASFTAIDISERKKAEELLIKSESRFKSLTEYGTDMITMYDENFRMIYRSDAAILLTGRKNEEIDPNNSILQYLHPDDAVKLQPTIHSLLTTKGKKIHERFRWLHQDGHYIWLEGTLVNLLHDENIRAIVTNTRDVTEDIKLRESQSLLASIVNSTDDAIISCDLNGKITSWNKSAEKLLGYKGEEAIGFDFKMFIPIDAVSLESSLMEDTLKGIHFNQIQTKRIKKTGEIIDISLNISSIRNEKDEIIGFSKIIRDISELKRKQEELELFKMLVENSSDAVIITEAEPFNLPGPKILYVNRAFTKISGYTPEEVIGQTPRILQGPLTDKNELTKLKKSLQKWEPAEIEVINYKKNGEPFWVNLSMAPVANEMGWYTHWISIQKDVTLRRREMEEKELLIKELTSNNKELKQFSYITSHNLRAPLTNLMSILKLLEIDTISDPRTVSLIEAFKSSTSSLKSTLDDLIHILIIKENTNQELVQVNFEEHLKKVLHSISNTIANAGAEISYDFSVAQSIHFISAYLESIFLNLITNAIKYAQPAMQPRIKIFTSIQNNQIQLTVTDNGLGMDWNKVKDKIFGLYQKFHRHPDSKGIGLYLVHSQVTALGGKIEVVTKPNEGSSFIITFDTAIL